MRCSQPSPIDKLITQKPIVPLKIFCCGCCSVFLAALQPNMDFNVVAQVNVDNSCPMVNEADSDSSASSVSHSDWLHLKMMLNLSPRQRKRHQASLRAASAGPTISQAMTKTATRMTKSLKTATQITKTVAVVATDSSQKQSSSEQLDVSEYMRLLQRLRRRRHLLGLCRGGQQQLQRLDAAQRRLRQLLAAREFDEGEGWEVAEESTGADEGDEGASSVTLLDCSLWNSSSLASGTASQHQSAMLDFTNQDVREDAPILPNLTEHQQEQRTGGKTDELSTLQVLPSDEPLLANSNLESANRSPEIALQMPEPLNAKAKKNLQAAMQNHQLPLPKAARPLPQLPNPQPPGLKSILALTPLTACRVPEPILSMAFDPVGRRLICAEPSRGICFRSVTFSGDDLAATCCRFDWRIWARSVCVLPSGHLLVATSCNLQVIRPNGVRLSVSDRQFPILAMAAYERVAYIATRKQDKDRENVYCIAVYDLPRLTVREHHAFQNFLPAKLPTDMCTLRKLAIIANVDDEFQSVEIESGHLRQSLNISSRKGPRHLAACNKLGVLFISMLAERCIHIYQLRSSDMLEKAGIFRDPAVLPGPLAWLPVNGILFCACSLAEDPRRTEIRALGLHQADRTNWTPRCIRLMPI